MDSSFYFFLFGLTIGISAGLLPGPFQTIIISQSLKYHYLEGLKVVASVLIADVIFISTTLLLLFRIGIPDRLLGIISILGFLYLLKLAYENFTTTLDSIVINKNEKSTSLSKGLAVLFLSPDSYLFWFIVGGPLIIKTHNVGWWVLLSFLAGLYIAYIGSSIGIVFVISKSKKFLQNKIYLYILRALGIVLVIFALSLLKYAFELF
ncbi:MAG: Lysine exporter protein (LYSE/YGGA) [Candidatus Roizmanbacteria bacterium GW2011_GWA2_37_7]|uniref:Lysine exporter protein (LYSE/YGGA) n=1 Tax=Candidatus Roizmanbacteria bacterium GW2011_GWA2_37_7 TaxID=1618481 RepID=A0A0G0H335_9BACT|nr:MAG: Lysine exporter protein (LYSE/YGGA) [Candidatus Roizmanbacteria bacterium GW2011_GWA2_37_7]